MINRFSEPIPQGPPAPVTDADAEQWQVEVEDRSKFFSGGEFISPSRADDPKRILRLLADRASYKERIGKLEQAVRHTSIHYHTANRLLKHHEGEWKDCMNGACPYDRALLEVPDAK